jgi:hypothetical protein
MDTVISQFIDNELNIDEKITFVRRIHTNRRFTDETVGFLEVEQQLRGKVADAAPSLQFVRQGPRFPRWLAFGGLAWAASLAVWALLWLGAPTGEMAFTPHRFVIYQPEAKQIELTGSFTNWRALPMEAVGSSGYWELRLDIPEGEHRFSYIIDGDQRLPDPTVPSREKDDFGGANSILTIEA